MTHAFVRTTIAERFPVFYSHANHAEHKRADDPNPVGPFYAPGSEWFEPFSPRNLAWKLRAAEALRRDGYTVTVDVVDRETKP